MPEVSAEHGDKIPSLPVEARAILHRYKEIHKCVKVTLVSVRIRPPAHDPQADEARNRGTRLLR